MYTPIRIDLHGAQVGEPINQSRLFPELLAKSITQVVGRVCGNEENGFPDTGELDGKGAGGGSFANTTFAADEDPTKGLLVDYGFKGWGEVFGVGVNRCRHGGWKVLDLDVVFDVEMVEIMVIAVVFLLQGIVVVLFEEHDTRDYCWMP